VKCFRCGKRDAVIDGLCRECYLETHELIEVQEYIDLFVCPHCLSISKDGNRWKDTEDLEKSIIDNALSMVKIPKNARIIEMDAGLREQDERNYILAGSALLDIGGMKEELSFESKIRLKRMTCPRCSRIHGGYYEAIIQVRGPNRAMTDEEKIEAEELIAGMAEEMGRSSRDVFITDEMEMHGGLDFYISNARAAKNIAKELSRRFSGKITESKKLAGRKEGEDIYRFTYLVRLPEFRKGDFIEYMGEYHQIISSSGGTWRIYSLEKRVEKKVRGGEVKKFKAVARKEDAEEAVVISYRDGEAQVLHPETYKTVTIKTEKDPGESIRIIRINGEIYALRDDE